MITIIDLGIKLLAAHFLADYGIQNEFVDKNKSPLSNHSTWALILLSHAFIHALLVYLVTNNIIFFFLELISHFIIDLGTCLKIWNHWFDQLLHIVIKLLYIAFTMIYKNI